jgi:hypothetical protein
MNGFSEGKPGREAGEPMPLQGSALTTSLWSVLARAGDGDSRASAMAMKQLYQVYWYPNLTPVAQPC